MDALSAFHGNVGASSSPEATENALLNLSKSICAASGIGFHKFNDSFFLRPFNAKA